MPLPGKLRPFALPAIVAFLCTIALSFSTVRALAGPDGDWSALPGGSPAPSARASHVAAYDPVSDRMIVFGGAEMLNDTWAWSFGSGTWQNLAPSGSPPWRKDASAIYDPVGHRMLVFGGFGPSHDGGGANYQNEVWALTLSGAPQWQLVATSGSPPAGRMFTSAVYDPVRNRVIVFGGHNGASYRLGDVWALDLATSTWAALVPTGPGPQARFAHVAAYDPHGDRMIVFGGWGGTTSDVALNDTWALALGGSPAWTQLHPSGAPPSARFSAAAAWDATHGRLLVHGGYAFTAASVQDDVWELDTSGAPAWRELTPTGPAPPRRHHHSAVLRTTAGEDEVVVFGGTGVAANGSTWISLGDLWALGWEPAPPGPPRLTSFTPSGGTAGDPVTVQGFDLENPTSVRFNGVPATVTYSDRTRIDTAVPAGATTGPIEVTTAMGTDTSDQDFVVASDPVIDSALPDSGRAGESITILGHHFTGALTVRFGEGGSAAFEVLSDTEIRATVDAGATTGPIRVTTPVGIATSGFVFRVVLPNPRPVLLAIRDVPHDQGGRVVLRWRASEYDVPGHDPAISGYRIWRRAPLFETSQRGLASREIGGPFAPDTWFWEDLGDVSAAFLEGYAFTAPTLYDSARHVNPYTAFAVQALTHQPGVFWFSNVDSGYSVDNLPPGPPSSLTGHVAPEGYVVEWAPNPEADLERYRLYAGTTADVPLDPDHLVAETTDESFVAPEDHRLLFHRLVAIDRNHNVSPSALLPPHETTSVEAGAARFALRGVEPNPVVAGDVTVSFSLPDASPARLTLFDPRGRRVAAREVGMLGAGDHRLKWTDGLAAGVYWIRLEQGARRATVRIAVLSGPASSRR